MLENAMTAREKKIAEVTLLSLRETAEMLSVSTRTLARWHAMRKGPPRVNAARSPRYRLEAVVRWLEANEVVPLGDFK